MAMKKSITRPGEYETRLNEVLTTLKQKINTCVQTGLHDTPESSFPLRLITPCCSGFVIRNKLSMDLKSITYPAFP